MAQMVGNMLLLAQTESRPQIKYVEEVNLANGAQALFDYYEGWVQERGIALALEGVASIPGDRLMLRRALGHLLSNAIRHTPPGGTVRVILSAARDGKPVSLSKIQVRKSRPSIFRGISTDFIASIRPDNVVERAPGWGSPSSNRSLPPMVERLTSPPQRGVQGSGLPCPRQPPTGEVPGISARHQNRTKQRGIRGPVATPRAFLQEARPAINRLCC